MNVFAAALVAVSVLGAVSAPARAAPPAPTGPHPRMLLDAELRQAWKAQTTRGPVKGAIALCQDAHETSRHERALYQGQAWARALQACLVAWVATEKPEYAKTAQRFFTALLDDRDRIGDGLGGDHAARRDSGYSIRNLGPYTALAYDWLHDRLPPELRARARERWAAWLDWYRAHGYRARVPGTNYQAGFLAAATMIAIAQAGETDEPRGGELWAFVADELWHKDMAAALAPGGILDGGDWPEGWQYGPLAVGHYALAARIARRAGIEVGGVDAWLAAILRRHVHGLTPAERVWPGGDTQIDRPYLEPHALTLGAIALGDAAPEDQRWAKGELARLQIVDRDFLLYGALATVGAKPALAPRARWPTWYLARATGTLFARTRWDERAVWLVAECQRVLDVDHRQPNAGNFALSRGRDDVIVDPSPYGSQSTLTSNAPTVASAHLPKHYIPSQAFWSRTTRWEWAGQTASGVVAARCDYADQYRFQHRASDVPDAVRDLVMLPSRDGTDASVVVIDRASTGGGDRALFLRFRVPGGLKLERETATARVGRTTLAIDAVARSSGKPAIGRPALKDCFRAGTVRGTCDAARFEVSDYRVEIAGPEPRAVHVIAATGGTAPKPTKLGGDGWAGVHVAAPRASVVVWPTKPGRALVYRAPRAAEVAHVVIDALGDAPGKAAGADHVAITARADGDACVVTVTPGGAIAARPAIVALDERCAVTADPLAASAASAAGTRPAPMPGTATRPRTAGCGAHAASGAPIAAVLLIGLFLRGRLRRED